jgi:hypothetical protein
MEQKTLEEGIDLLRKHTASHAEMGGAAGVYGRMGDVLIAYQQALHKEAMLKTPPAELSRGLSYVIATMALSVLPSVKGVEEGSEQEKAVRLMALLAVLSQAGRVASAMLSGEVRTDSYSVKDGEPGQ